VLVGTILYIIVIFLLKTYYPSNYIIFIKGE
jgi:hypothetical protein